jgi:hypothetical protein
VRLNDDSEPSARASEVKDAFLALLSRSGLRLETLDPLGACRAMLAFYRDVKFDWVAPAEDDDVTDELLVEIEVARTPGKAVNPILALFKQPEPGPPEAVFLSFARDLTAHDEDDVYFYLELMFRPDGLDGLEEISLYADAFESLEDFARELLGHDSMRTLAILEPAERTLEVI